MTIEGLDIPFKDIFWTVLKFTIASLLIYGIGAIIFFVLSLALRSLF